MIMKCACCGGDMKPDKDTGNSIIYKCSECGLSDSRLKEGEERGEELVAKEEEKEKEEKKSC
jgi:DNA-directed RNA polymerase subunit M/transcription elongation factor TFIIS